MWPFYVILKFQTNCGVRIKLYCKIFEAILRYMAVYCLTGSMLQSSRSHPGSVRLVNWLHEIAKREQGNWRNLNPCKRFCKVVRVNKKFDALRLRIACVTSHRNFATIVRFFFNQGRSWRKREIENLFVDSVWE